MSKDIREKRNRFYYKSCGSKTKYKTEEEANDKALEALEYRSISLFTYFCTICFGWHLSRKDSLSGKRKKR